MALITETVQMANQLSIRNGSATYQCPIAIDTRNAVAVSLEIVSSLNQPVCLQAVAQRDADTSPGLQSLVGEEVTLAQQDQIILSFKPQGPYHNLLILTYDVAPTMGLLDVRASIQREV